MKRSILVVILLLLSVLLSDVAAQTSKNKRKARKKTNTVTNTSASPVVAAPADLNDPAPVKDSLLKYAVTLIGTPYKYASTDPAVGFDCSGFITHVFNHFNLKVPRSSVDFTNYGREIPKESALPGDLILFTGTDSAVRVVGHMGIILENQKEGIRFIHSSSGHAHGVTITPLNTYYLGRFVKTIRIFRD